MKPIEYLQLGVEQFLRELPDTEWEQLVARVRPPGLERRDAPTPLLPMSRH